MQISVSRDSRSMGNFWIPSPPKLHWYHQLARAVDLVPVRVLWVLNLKLIFTKFNWWLIFLLGQGNKPTDRTSFCSVSPLISSSVRNFCDGLSVATDSSRWRRMPSQQRHKKNWRVSNIQSNSLPLAGFFDNPLRIRLHKFSKFQVFFERQVLHGITTSLKRYLESAFYRGLYKLLHYIEDHLGFLCKTPWSSPIPTATDVFL